MESIGETVESTAAERGRLDNDYEIPVIAAARDDWTVDIVAAITERNPKIRSARASPPGVGVAPGLDLYTGDGRFPRGVVREDGSAHAPDGVRSRPPCFRPARRCVPR